MGLARADTLQIQGHVVDASGRPVAGAIVSDSWRGNKGAMKPGDNSVTGDDGTFALKIGLYGRAVGIMAIDAEQARGAVAAISPHQSNATVVLTLAPLVTVRGRFACAELEQQPKWSNVYFSLLPDKVQLASDSSEPPRFSLKVPPGEYELNGYASFNDYQAVRKPITVPAGRPEFDLGRIDLPATPISRNYGKPAPPWHVTAARGVSKRVRLADFRGRWLLVEFWGFW
jgi:hypothetical protein